MQMTKPVSRAASACLLTRTSIVQSSPIVAAMQATRTRSRQPHDLVLMSTCELSIHGHGASRAEAVQAHLSEVPADSSPGLLSGTVHEHVRRRSSTQLSYEAGICDTGQGPDGHSN